MNSPKAPSGHSSPLNGMPRLDVSPFELARVARARLGHMPLLDFKLASRNVGKDRCCLCVQYFSGRAPSAQCRRCGETVCQSCICACCLCQKFVCGFCRAKSMTLGDAPGRQQAEEAMRFRVCNACVDRFATAEEDQAPVETWQRFHEGRFRHLHARPKYAMHMVLGPLVVAGGNKPIAATNVTPSDLGLCGGEEEAKATMNGGGRSEKAAVGKETGAHRASSEHAGCPTGPASATPDPTCGPAPVLVSTPAAAPTTAPSPAPVPLCSLASGPMPALKDSTATEDAPLKHGGRHRDGFATNDTSPLSSRNSSLSSKSFSSLLAPGCQAGEVDGKGGGCPQEVLPGGVVELRQMWESLTVRGSSGAEKTPSSPTAATPAAPSDLADRAGPTPTLSPPAPAFPRPFCSAPEIISEREAGGAGGEARHEVAEKDVGISRGKRDDGEIAEGESEPDQESKGWRAGYKRGLAYGGLVVAVGVAVWAIVGRRPPRG